jgi:hypothetical protein
LNGFRVVTFLEHLFILDILNMTSIKLLIDILGTEPLYFTIFSSHSNIFVPFKGDQKTDGKLQWQFIYKGGSLTPEICIWKVFSNTFFFDLFLP